MTFPSSLLCLVLGWPAAGPGKASPPHEVMLVKSGMEIVVKKDGQPWTVRLLGIETPMTGAESPAMDRQSQTNHLRKLVAVGSKVRVVTNGDLIGASKGTVRAQVYRSKDDLWLNHAMIDQGFATASKESPAAVYSKLLAAETRARQEVRGMWAPDFHDKAAEPTRFERTAKSRSSTRNRPRAQFIDTPPGGGMPALGMGLVPSSMSGLPYQPVAPAYRDPVWESNYGLGLGSTPMLNPYFYPGNFPGFGLPFPGQSVAGGSTAAPRSLPSSDRNRQAIQQRHLMRMQAQQSPANAVSQGAAVNGPIPSAPASTGHPLPGK